MPDWNTRLEVMADNKVVSPIDTFTPTFVTSAEVIHSIESDNVGMLYKPSTATFQMQVKANSTSVVELTKLALEGKKFDIQVAEKDGTDWSFKKLLFRSCVITKANPSNITIDGAPVATFDGVILDFGEESDMEI
jgi:hypothetical protein